MFKNKKGKDKEIDYTSLNVILRTGKHLINIGYFTAIVLLVLIGTYVLKEWKVLTFIKDLLVVISPIFIGFLIAWLFEPLVTKLEKNKIQLLLYFFSIYRGIKVIVKN